MSKNNEIQALVEARMNEMKQQKLRLVEGWSKHIKAINEHMRSKQGREMTEIETMNVAQCLENALQNSGLRSSARLFEATTEDSTQFLGIQLPVIAALLPSLVLNDIASVQALDRRIGGVFYLDVRYGSDKGGVSSGDTMLSSLTGHARSSAVDPGNVMIGESQRTYASTLVRGESTGITSTGTYTLAYAPGVDVTTNRRNNPERTIVLRDKNSLTILASDSSSFSGSTTDHAGTLKTAANLSVGSVTAAGVLTIDESGASITDDTSTGYIIDYCYTYDKPVDAYNNRSGVPEADVYMAQSTVTAIDFPIRSKYSLGAAIDVQKAHGINLESELTKYLGGEVRFTVDHFGIDMIDKVACGQYTVPDPFSTTANLTPATACTSWNAGIASGQEWVNNGSFQAHYKVAQLLETPYSLAA